MGRAYFFVKNCTSSHKVFFLRNSLIWSSSGYVYWAAVKRCIRDYSWINNSVTLTRGRTDHFNTTNCADDQKHVVTCVHKTRASVPEKRTFLFWDSLWTLPYVTDLWTLLSWVEVNYHARYLRSWFHVKIKLF